MASSCPDGTVVTGASQYPSTPADITTLHVAFDAFVSTVSGWSVTTGYAEGKDYSIVRPDDGSNGGHIFTFSLTKFPDVAQRAETETGYVTCGSTPDRVYYGMIPDLDIDDIEAAWDSAAGPFASYDFSRFNTASDTVSSKPVIAVFGGGLVASGGGAEIFEVFFQESVILSHMVRCGAIIAQYDDDNVAVDPVRKRIWSYTCTGRQAILLTFLNAYAGAYSSKGAVDEFVMYALVSGTWTRVMRPILDETLDRMYVSSPTVFYPTLVVPVSGYISAPSYGFLRNTRAMFAGVKKLMDPVSDLAGSPIGYAIGYSTTIANHTLVFVSGAP